MISGRDITHLRLGRWLSPDWSAVPAPVPYANLNNPQTLNLYAMVSDNPETFADLDGHEAGDFSSSDAFFRYLMSQDFAKLKNEQRKKQQEQQKQHGPKKKQGVAAAQTYKTRDEAAKAAEKSALDATDKAGRKYEYGGWILKNKDGLYTYTIPITFNDSGHFFPDSENLPDGYKGVADYHTHHHIDSAEGSGFSVGDQDHAIFYGRVGYVADTYSRDMFRYTPLVTTWKPNEYCCGSIGDFVAHIPQ